MNQQRYIFHRIGFLEGLIEGIKLYAIWRNGEQIVGCMQSRLQDVLKPYQEELVKLRESSEAKEANGI